MANHARTITSTIEEQAANNDGLSAFEGFSLANAKKCVSELLNLIGRSTIFDQYTVHDISHINSMLELLEWTIPPETRDRLTTADALLITLSVYLHDLGMLVTEREFERRDSSDFHSFKESKLLSGPDASDYMKKVESLGADAAERFYYQEFIRAHHAVRIEKWVIGDPATHLGDASEVANQLHRILAPLSAQFRDDLALTCKSHHEDDIGDTTKYRVRKAYGPTDAEVANIQFAAIALRSADILHMTSDRAPSITFKATNPTDPISQREWSKQMGVQRVCSQLGTDREGARSETAPRDTIEIHAYFEEAEPYFALNAFLKYVEGEITQCHTWAARAAKEQPGYNFPWKYINTDAIETKGFLSRSYAFEVDQPRILKLLTGHTLYNDASVVIRELAQNALDAIRLRQYQDKRQEATHVPGEITIHWNSTNATLSITDNGTGMSQENIERHFLTVGSSRYTNPKFIEKHPDFNPISRFGIGVLSAFMVADKVDVYTASSEDDEARHISLRNLLGKYLIRLLPKTHSAVRDIAPTGSRIVLQLRPSASLKDIEAAARKWILIPDADVLLIIDDEKPKRIGHSNTKEALTDLISAHRDALPASQSTIEVRTETIDNVEISYGVTWSEYFQDWQFATSTNEGPLDERLRSLRQSLGLAVHGIRVESGNYGFQTPRILVLANAHGSTAPRTTVARSGLEQSEESTRVLGAIYEALVSHIEAELTRLRSSSGTSLDWAITEAGFMLSPLTRSHPIDHSLFSERLESRAFQLTEFQGKRSVVPPSQLREETHLWTIESPQTSHSTLLLREAQSEASLSDLNELLGVEPLPDGHLLYTGPFRQYTLRDREIDAFRVIAQERRVECRWRRIADSPAWKRLSPRLQSQFHRFVEYRFLNNVTVATEQVDILGDTSFSGVHLASGVYFLPESNSARTLGVIIDRLNAGVDEHEGAALMAALASQQMDSPRQFLNEYLAKAEMNEVPGIDIRDLEAVWAESSELFNPFAWERSK